MRSKKNMIQQRDKVVLDGDEVVMETKFKVFRAESEPPFIKLYVSDLIKLNNLPLATHNVLNELLKNLAYDNEIVIVAPIKRKIMEALNIKLATVNKAILNLVRSDILIRKDRSFYLVNPNLFARGSWEDIKRIRLSIEYTSEGSSIKTEYINS